jgi:hypothetical protein
MFLILNLGPRLPVTGGTLQQGPDGALRCSTTSGDGTGTFKYVSPVCSSRITRGPLAFAFGAAVG